MNNNSERLSPWNISQRMWIVSDWMSLSLLVKCRFVGRFCIRVLRSHITSGDGFASFGTIKCLLVIQPSHDG